MPPAGNFIGPLVFLQKEKPLYTTGWIVTVSLATIFMNLKVSHRPLISPRL